MRTSTKAVASLAIVGTIAASLAVLNYSSTPVVDSTTRFLAAEGANDEVKESFVNFINKHQRNYLTKEEFQARLRVFKKNYEIVKDHNA